MTFPQAPAGRCLLMCSLALAVTAHAQQATEPAIKDFLADTGGTYVGAGGIISLDNKLMSNAATPKDFVVAVGQGQADMSKAGFGIAWAPWRSKLFDKLSLDIRRSAVGQDYTGGLSARIFSAMTLSYAQNHREIDKLLYPQSAWALFTEYYPRVDDDPAVRAYKWIVGLPSVAGAAVPGASCKALSDVREAAYAASPPDASQSNAGASMVAAGALRAPSGVALKLASAKTGTRAKWPSPGIGPLAMSAAAPGTVTADHERLQPAPNLAAEYEVVKRAAISARAAVAAGDATKLPELRDAEELQKLVGDCANEALEVSRQQWNAAKLTLLAGRGTIKGPNVGDPTLSLGTHIQLGYQWAPADNKDMLLKLTLHHARNALDIDTLNKTPAFGSRTLAALRYMYGWGEDRQLFYLAEVSNLNQRSAGVMSGAFKYVLGVDKKLADSLWLELRYGRSQVRASEKEETKAMANLKFSFDSELAALKPAR